VSPRVLLGGSPDGILGPARLPLEKAGFDVVPVATPELLEPFRVGAPPALFLVDEAFGPSGGVAFCRGLREDPWWRPVSLVLAVPAGEQHLEECLVAGINDFLLAPFPDDELVFKVRRLTAVPARREATGLVSIRGGRLGGGTVVGKTLNFSTGGLLVEAESYLTVGRKVDLVFFVPDGGPPAACRARVVRRASELSLFHPAYGLEYEEISDADRARVEAWVAAQGPEGIPPAPER